MFTQASTNAHIRHFTARLVAPILPLLVCGLVGLVLGPPETARAQTDVKPNMPKVVVENAPTPTGNTFNITSAPWRAHFGEHAADVLSEADPEAEQAAMRDLIEVATYGEGEVDLTATLPELLEVAEHSASEVSRLMAMEAVASIGTKHSQEPRYREAMEKLYRIAQEESSDRVRRAATGVLLDFYGDEE